MPPIEPPDLAEEARAEVGLPLHHNRQPYCDECGAVLPPAPGRTLGDETHCPACRVALGA